MSANIPSVLALFPDKSTSSPKAGPSDSWITGPVPLEALSDQMRIKVEAVATDERWAPLWRGDPSKYDSDHSAADLALCGELVRRGLSEKEIDTAFRASGLYRDKWERNDYRARTIAKAMVGIKKPEEPSRTSPSRLHLEGGLIRVELAPPPPRDWTLADIILSVKSCVLAGFGGTSKTQLVIHLSLAIALGTAFMGKTVKQGKVLLLMAEEDREEIARRINAVIRHKGVGADAIQRIRDNILGFGLVGEDTRLTSKLDGSLRVTPFGKDIIDLSNEYGDVRLIVLDHVALFHGGDFNAREDAALTMRVVNHIAKETGASVLLLAHSPKAARGAEESDASMVAGSTAFVDQARAALVMAGMRDAEAKKYGIAAEDRSSYVSLMVAKNNYGPTGGVYWFRRVSFDGVGLLDFVELTPPAPAAKGLGKLELAVLEFVLQHRGRFAKTRLRDSYGGKDGLFKASKGQVEAAIETLLADGRLIAREPTQAEREKFDMSVRVQRVLDVGKLKL